MPPHARSPPHLSKAACWELRTAQATGRQHLKPAKQSGPLTHLLDTYQKVAPRRDAELPLSVRRYIAGDTSRSNVEQHRPARVTCLLENEVLSCASPMTRLNRHTTTSLPFVGQPVSPLIPRVLTKSLGTRCSATPLSGHLHARCHYS